MRRCSDYVPMKIHHGPTICNGVYRCGGGTNYPEFIRRDAESPAHGGAKVVLMYEGDVLTVKVESGTSVVVRVVNT